MIKSVKSYMKKTMAGIAGLLLFCNMTVYAAKEEVVEHFTVEDKVVLYISGAEGEVGETSYQIGTTACEVESLVPLKEAEEGIRTLILWDNSLSVMKRCGDRVKAILADVVANRAAGEQFSVAVIDKKVNYLSEFTDDYTSLKQTIEGVTGEDKDAYITENLYMALEDLNKMEPGVYKRIIVVSDGMDAMETGYSRSELETLITKMPYPIYTIGNLSNNDQESLQNLFSLSRLTKAAYFNLSEIEDDMSVVQAISADYSFLQMKAVIPLEIQDGSVQNSQLTMNVGGKSVTVQSEVALPFAAPQETKEEPVESSEPESLEPAEPSEPETSMATEVSASEVQPKDNRQGILKILMCIIAVAAVGLVVAVIVAVVLLNKGKKKVTDSGNNYSELDSRLKNERYGTGMDDSKTEVIQWEPKSEGRTVMLFGGKDQEEQVGTSITYRLVLTNTRDSVQSYQCNFTDRLIIGRNATYGNLKIPDGAVSKEHCAIFVQDGRFYVEDLNSSNGTYLNGNSERIKVMTEISTGTIMKLGQNEYEVTVGQL